MISVPLTYQGGKQRIAPLILDIIQPDKSFYDLCCGSGAITIEYLNRGAAPEQCIMVDTGPFGLVWEAVGTGQFDIEKFKEYIDDIPKDQASIKSHMEKLSKQQADIDTEYVYLLLQASSFGGKALWIDNNRWKNTSFRSYWLPTPTSNRRSPVNPMMPMPNTLLDRISVIYTKMKGINGKCTSANNINPEPGAIIYIDPPYQSTTGYGTKFDVVQLAKRLSKTAIVYVSEALPLPEASEHICIAGPRAKGGISGKRKSQNEEWLSIFK